MGARWLVDGNNVMGARPDGWWRDRRAAAVRLVESLRAWRPAGDEVIVVFDGRDDPALTALAEPGLEVRTAGSGRRDAADDVIVALAGELEATVVTSDAGLRSRLPPGTPVEGAGRFRAMLDGGR